MRCCECSHDTRTRAWTRWRSRGGKKTWRKRLTATYTRLIHSRTHGHTRTHTHALVPHQYSLAGARWETVSDVGPLSGNRTPDVSSGSRRVFMCFASLLNTLIHTRTLGNRHAAGRKRGSMGREGGVIYITFHARARANTRMYPGGDFRTAGTRAVTHPAKLSASPGLCG